jgi:sugar/nucleoside kinase (ribokinase family)
LFAKCNLRMDLTKRRIDVVAAGPFGLSLTSYLEGFPKIGQGAFLDHLSFGIGSDAAKVAFLLRAMGCSSGLIGNDLPRGPLGLFLLQQLRHMGIRSHIKLSNSNPIVDLAFCTQRGGRTWLAYHPSIDRALKRANVRLLKTASVMYVDCYSNLLDWAHGFVQRAPGIPCLVNIGDYDLMYSYINRANNATQLRKRLGQVMSGRSFVQVSIDNKSRKASLEVARACLLMGAEGCLLTQGKKGASYISASEEYSVPSPIVDSKNPAGAGAAFSAGFIYGHLRGWKVSQSLKFAVCSGALYCSRPPGLESLKSHTLKAINQMI